MLRNFFIIFVRNFLKNKTYSLINVFGLVIGLTYCILIWLFVLDEFSYERNHVHANNIYKILRSSRKNPTNHSISEGTSGPLGERMRYDYPEVKNFVRILDRDEVWVRYSDQRFEQKFCVADANILEMFSLPLIKGNPETVLLDPFSVLITEEMANKYFKDQDPIGKIIVAEHHYVRGDYKVTGVLKNMPHNSILQIDFLTSTIAQERILKLWEEWRPDASWNPIQNYILVPNERDAVTLQQKLNESIKNYIGQEASRFVEYHFQPLRRIYLYSNVDYGIKRFSDITNVHILLLCTVFIIVIACINFTTMATARAGGRAKEVGIRKVVGAFRLQLIQQFLGESILLALLSLLLSLICVSTILPEFNSFTNKELSLKTLAEFPNFLWVLSLVFCVGMVAGIYPAFFLSQFQITHVFMQEGSGYGKNSLVRKCLVVLQFSISIALVICTFVLYNQLSYIRHKNLGFSKNNIIIMPLFWVDRSLPPGVGKSLIKKFEIAKQEILQCPQILSATVNGYLPGMVNSTGNFLVRGNEEEEIQMHLLIVDEDFFQTYSVELLTGRKFSKDIQSDARKSFILNESAVKYLGLVEPIGHSIEWKQKGREGKIIGIVKDFHFRSLHEKIGPLVMCIDRDFFYYLAVKIRLENISDTLDFLEAKWKYFIPSRPFQYEFLDEHLEQGYYASAIKLSKIASGSTLLIILVACLGMLGLTSYTIEQRTKEISIRKILGASMLNIIVLIAQGFIPLVLLANLVAWPVAYYLTSDWLMNFAYRVDLNVGPFILGSFVNFAIIFGIVGVHAYIASQTNPIDSLRHE